MSKGWLGEQLVQRFGATRRWLGTTLRQPGQVTIIVVWALLAAHAALFFWVCDDAFISFRYAEQLLDGHGLVFNAGERVEGYTNLLWVLEVALLSVFGISMAAASVLLSGLATAGTLLLTARLARATPFPSMRSGAVIAALLWLAVNRNVAIWTTSGLETRQFTFLVLLAVWLARGALAGRGSWVMVSLVLAATELTRPEGALIAGCVGSWAAWQLLRAGRLQLRPLLELGVPCAVVVLGHYLWRYAYYGDWLPNTAYAKVVRPWPDAGILYYGAALVQTGLYLGLPLAVAGGWLRWLRKRDPLLSLSAFVILPHALYIVIIGGDHFEFRPLDYYWPLLAVGIGDAFAALGLWLRLRARRARSWRAPGVSRLFWAGALGTLLVYSTVLQLAQLVVEYPRRAKRDLRPEPPVPVTVAAFPVGQLLPWFDSLVNAYQGTLTVLTSHAIAVSWVEHRPFQATLLNQYGPYGRAGRARFPEGAVMAHQWMGIIPYYLPEITVIDKFGLTDRTIARSGQPANARRTMAHDRSPPPGYLESRGINVEVAPAAHSLEEALALAPYALELAPRLWAPFDSQRPDWVKGAFGSLSWYHPDFNRPERSVLAGRKARGARTLLDCESTPAGWSLAGARCAKGPGKDEGRVAGVQGRAWLTTYGEDSGDRQQARASSAPFDAGPWSVLMFEIGGGSGPGVRAVLRAASGEELASFAGQNDQTLRAQLFDLKPYAGRSLRFEISDTASGGWGHLLVDAVNVIDVEAFGARAPEHEDAGASEKGAADGSAPPSPPAVYSSSVR